MANEPQKPDNRIIEIENTDRQRYVFPIVEEMPNGELKTVERLIIGDSADRICYGVDESTRDPLKQPNPIVRWTKAQWDRLGAVNQKVLRHYFANGMLRVTQGRELVGA